MMKQQGDIIDHTSSLKSKPDSIVDGVQSLSDSKIKMYGE